MITILILILTMEIRGAGRAPIESEFELLHDESDNSLLDAESSPLQEM